VGESPPTSVDRNSRTPRSKQGSRQNSRAFLRNMSRTSLLSGDVSSTQNISMDGAAPKLQKFASSTSLMSSPRIGRRDSRRGKARDAHIQLKFDTYDRQIEKLRMENQKLKEQLEKIRPLEKQLKLERKNLQKKQRRIDAEKDAWEDVKNNDMSLVNLFQKIDTKLKQLSDQHESLQDDRDELKEQQQLYEKERSELQDRLDALADEENNLKKENNELMKRQRIFEQTNANMLEKIEELEQLKELHDQVRAEQNTLNQEKEEQLELKKLADDKWIQVLEKETLVTEMTRENEMKLKKVQDENERQVMQRKQNETLLEELDELRKIFEEEGADKEVIIKKLEELAQEEVELQKMTEDFKLERKQWEEDKKKEEDKIELRMRNITSKESELEQAYKDIQEKMEQHEADEVQLTEQWQRLSQKERDLENDENFIDKSVLQKANDEIEKMTGRVRRLEKKLESQETANHVLRHSLDEVKSMTIKQITDFGEKEKELITAKAQLEEFKSNFDRLIESRLRDKETEIERLHEQLRLVHEAARAETDRKIAGKDKEIEQLKQEVLKMRAMAHTKLSDLADTLLTNDNRSQWLIIQKEKDDFRKEKDKFSRLQKQWIQQMQGEMTNLTSVNTQLHQYRKPKPPQLASLRDSRPY